MLTSRRFPNRVFAAYYRFTHQIHRPADYPVNTPVFFHRKKIFKRLQHPARMPPDSMTQIRVLSLFAGARTQRQHSNRIHTKTAERNALS